MYVQKGKNMKNISSVLAVVFLLLCSIPTQAADIHASYDTLLKRYVHQGMVDYKSLKAQRAPLDAYLQQMARVSKQEFTSWSKDAQLAYLINLYNAATLKLIIDNYPLKSIKDIGSLFSGPWKKEIVLLFGKFISLDNLEHDIIRKDYQEPRIHLALVCAAQSCPPLRSEAYTGQNLHKQLDDQGYKFFSGPHGLRVDSAKNTVHLSSILKWYKEDFFSVLAFAEKYAQKKFSNFKIEWLPYDWSLNEKK